MSEEKLSPNRKEPKGLSAPFVRNVTEPGRYGDGGGLYLDVRENGSRLWVLRTTIHGKRHDLGLGSARFIHGRQVVTLAEAREKAFELRKLARAGGDPLALKKQEKERRKAQDAILTFEEAAKRVHQEHSKTFSNPKHSKQWIGSLETFAFPVFGDRRVDQITSADILEGLTPIWSQVPETASRVKQRLKTVFDWCKASGFRPGDNPTDGITKVLPKHRKGEREHFPALPYVQVPEFIGEVRQYEGISARLAFEFLVLCAARTSEVLYARWSEIHIETKTWTIPAARMKAKLEHKVPLSPRCLEILEAAKEISDGAGYVFPGPRHRRPFSNMALHTVLDGLERKFHDAQGREITPHGFRSSFRDWASERTHFSREVCEAALAHTRRDKTEAAYHRSDLFEKRRELMEAWAQFATAPAAQVVRFRA